MTERERKLSIAMNVHKDHDLPEAGYNVAEFINILREQLEDDFDIDIQVGVNPVIETAPAEQETPYVGFIKTDELSIEELDEEDEEECYDDRVKVSVESSSSEARR